MDENPVPALDLGTMLLGLLTGLSGLNTADDRRDMIDHTGLQHLHGLLVYQGNPRDFFRRLLNVLVRQGRPELVRFLTQLDRWVGAPELQQQLEWFRYQIERLPDDALPQLLVPDLDLAGLLRRCQEASADEIEAMVGTKYIAELYFRRPQIESRFDRFLDAEATCFLVVAMAGRGKTNLLCHLVEQFQQTRPVLFLSGRLGLQDRYSILRHIAVRLAYNEADWLACFEELGQPAAAGASPLILIDGINESAAEPSLMREALQELLSQAERRRIKVCISCRNDFWLIYRRASFWDHYVWREDPAGSRGKVRGEDLPLFPEATFGDVVSSYFRHFDVRGELTGEAWESCRNPLLLRFFCEAYGKRDVGVVTDIRLYGLFELFWERKVGQVTDLAGLGRSYPVNNLVITVARLMHEQRSTIVPRALVAQRLGEQEVRLDETASLYGRVLSEEILFEDEIDPLLGTRNVRFVYDKFAEYAIALGIFSAFQWMTKSSAEVVDDARRLMWEEAEHAFATLRGSIEFLVLRMEDRRTADQIHVALLRAMLDQDWKWRRIGTELAFQLEHTDDESFWRLLWSLVTDERHFVRRISAGQLRTLARRAPDRALGMLNVGLADESDTVRDTALDTLRNLDPPAAIREAELLATTRPLGDRSGELAAEALLWPRDSDSLLLREKFRWLVDGDPDPAVRAAVLDYLSAIDAPAHEGLYDLEELKRALDASRQGARTPRADDLDEPLELSLTRHREALNADLDRLDTLYRVASELVDLTIRTFDMRRAQPLAVLTTTLDVLVPDPDRLALFLDEVRRQFRLATLPTGELADAEWESVDRYVDQAAARSWFRAIRNPLPDDPLPTLGWLALRVAHGTGRRRGVPFGSFALRPEQTSPEGFTPQLTKLFRVSSYVLEEGARRSAKDLDDLTLHDQLGEGGLELQADAAAELQTTVARQFGVALPAVRQRALTSLGRLVLWIWQASEAQATQEQDVEQRTRELAELEIDAIHQTLAPFENQAPASSVQLALVVQLRALCRLYAATQPAKVVEALAPLIRWHHERDSSVVHQAFATLLWQDRTAFWSVVQEMLEHEDQPVVSFADQVLEQAESDQQSSVGAVLGQLRDLLAIELGVESSRVVPDAELQEELELDSLDLVEVVLAVEERFGIEIFDDQIAALRTVRDVVELIQVKLGDRSPAPPGFSGAPDR